MSPDQPLGLDPDAPPRSAVDVATASHLIIHLGDNLYGLPTESVTRVVEAQRPVRVPTASAHFIGVVHIRGQILAVVGLREVLEIGGDEPQETATRRLVALDVEGQPFAFIADSVLGIRDVPLTAIRALDRAPEDEGTSAVRGEFDQTEGVVSILEPAAIVRGLS